MDIPVSIVNPAFIFKDWGNADVEVKVNGNIVDQGDNLRIGYEQHGTGTDLVIWIKHKAMENLQIEIKPLDKNEI